MKTTFTLLFFIAISLSSASIFAQNGEFDARFVYHNVDCANSLIYVDIEVKAKGQNSTFNIADQNYRFSFNRNVLDNPQIAQELTLSGTIFTNAYSALFDPHHLQGTIDTIVSYNVVLAGGTGYPINDAWTSVGRLAFDVLDPDGCIELIWHDNQPQNFPPTFISEKTSAGALVTCAENLYANYSNCNINLCPIFPIELAAFDASANDCSVDVTWTTMSEIDNDYFILERSYNGQEYTQIAKINGSGNAVEPVTYQFTDRASGPLNYYRLTQVDFDGDSETFDVVSVKTNCEKQLIGISELFPNPVSNSDNHLTIKFMNQVTTQSPQLLITSIDGRLVAKQDIILTEGFNSIQYNTQQLPAGVYLLQINDTNWQSETTKFVKIDE